jgi:uncharacterized membrane protein
MMIPERSQERFEWIVKPNRSLAAKGRTLWFLLIAASAMLVAIGATAVGAWPVLPFAGLEAWFVWFAFRVVAKRDGDYEKLQVVDQQFAWECCAGGKVQCLRGNAAWAQVRVERRKQNCRLWLRYGSDSVALGRFVTDIRREQLLIQMVRIFPAAT